MLKELDTEKIFTIGLTIFVIFLTLVVGVNVLISNIHDHSFDMKCIENKGKIVYNDRGHKSCDFETNQLKKEQ